MLASIDVLRLLVLVAQIQSANDCHFALDYYYQTVKKDDQ